MEQRSALHVILWRIFRHPELLFIGLVVIVPVAFAFLWQNSPVGFLLRMLFGLAAGLAIWLAIIFLIVRPRYRNY